jgi:predicted nucleotidyltransferase
MLGLLERDKQFHRYSVYDLKEIYLRRALQNAIRFNDFVKQEQRKVLQGNFLCSDYFIRCIKDWQEVTESYGDVRYRPMGRCRISAEISDDAESLLSPCRYSLERVHVLAGKASLKLREVISFRGRFAEQVRVGERIIARGRLEAVHCGESHYHRLVVGEGRTDILRTVW